MNKILFIDLLTTGMNVERCGICRIGGIFTEDGKEIQRFEFNVRPFRNALIRDESLNAGCVTRSELIYFPDEKDVFRSFIGLLDRHVNPNNPLDKIYLAGFNIASCDTKFLREWFKRMDCDRFRDYFFVQDVDVMGLANFALMNERRALPSFKLDAVATYLGIMPRISRTFSCLTNAETALEIYRVLKVRFHLGEAGDRKRTDNIVRNF